MKRSKPCPPASVRGQVPVFRKIPQYTAHGCNITAPPGRHLMVCDGEVLRSQIPDDVRMGFGQMRYHAVASAVRSVAKEKFPGYICHLSIPDFVISVALEEENGSRE